MLYDSKLVMSVLSLNVFNSIKLTCPYNVDPLTPHFYIHVYGKIGVYRGVHFLIFALKQRL